MEDYKSQHHQMISTMTFRFNGKPDIVAKCLECGMEIADGCLSYRSLDAFDEDPEPCCPSETCGSGNLEHFLPREKED